MKKKGLAALFGKCPGSESDDDTESAMREIKGARNAVGQIVFDKVAFRVRLAQLGFRSVSEFARKARLSGSTVLQTSLGLLPSPEYRKKFAAALGMHSDDLWKLIPQRVFDNAR